MIGCSLSFWVFVFVTLNSSNNMLIESTSLLRSKRWLIYPRQAPTRLLFIAGIGVPADLEYESLTVGYTLKGQFFLPYNVTTYRENPFYPEYKSEYNATYHGNHGHYGWESRSSKLRWNLYSCIAQRLDSYGYSGTECILKAICEASSLSFQRLHGVFEQIVHILLSPSSSVDQATPQSVQYIEAEKIGSSSGDCGFYNCKISVLDWISSVLKVES
ncbi:uncharacterized protein LOC120773118 [Bactrocera tryoni]|uniref:uncharacterized protein LOC120773118 n=1 Tax=Bactrocera tryoni TaxID=59916 RepID=UPI001A962398|nr:uncharacterized protein LOC120773118 [Bactrocera tryoni]